MTERLSSSAEQVQELFDAKAATWSEKYALDGRLTSRMARLHAAISLHVRMGGEVLDLGCGTGDLARSIASTGLRTTACDISPQMLSQAATADTAGAVEWVRLGPGWTELPFETGSFDAVLASSVLEYVDDPHRVLAECSRVLRPGGVLIGTVPNLMHPVRWLEWLGSKAIVLPGLGAVARRLPRSRGYLVYLQVSRQRHTARWWCAVGERARLRMIRASGRQSHQPLSLLIFSRITRSGDRP